MRAAETYLAVAIIGGMVMLMGLFLLWNAVGTLAIDELYEAAKACPNKGRIWAASICILFGFGAKAGMFPLHIWLPKAHPVAPAPASALLSGILTKSGIFGVIVVSANIFRASTAWGNLILVLGLITMLGGAVLAVFSVNLKRTLACSSMSQIGFILTGIAMGCLLGEENALAARGALLYMVNHSLFKLILFMAAGVVYMNLHKLNLNDVRGFGRKKPILHFAFLMGAVGLMGVPGFSGYVSKTLIHEGIVEYAELLAEEGMGALALLYRGAEWIYLFSGGLTGAYMIKLYICLFWEKHPTQQIAYETKKPYMGKLSALALFLSAAIVPILGLTPNLTMDKIADIAGGFLNAATPAHAVNYFSLTNIKGACISLVIGLVVYLAFIRPVLTKKEAGVREYVDLWPSWLDIEDRVYRPAIYGLLDIGGRFAGLGSEITLETYVYRPLIRALTLFFAAVFGFLGGLTDFVADLLARKVLSARKKKPENNVGNAITRAVGGVFDGIAGEDLRIGTVGNVVRRPVPGGVGEAVGGGRHGRGAEPHRAARPSDRAPRDGEDLRRVGRHHGRGQPDEPHDELWFAALRSGSVRDAAVFDVLLRMYQKSAAFYPGICCDHCRGIGGHSSYRLEPAGEPGGADTGRPRQDRTGKPTAR